MSDGTAWTVQERTFAQGLLDNGAYPSDVAQRVSRKFKTARTSRSVNHQILKGALRGKSTEKDPEHIIALRRDHKLSYRALAGMFEMSQRRVMDICIPVLGAPPMRRTPKLSADIPADDPIADIGFTLLDLQANQCRYPIARWPKEYSQQRFCGEHRDTENGKFVSSYCPGHRVLCRREKPMREAAE